MQKGQVHLPIVLLRIRRVREIPLLCEQQRLNQEKSYFQDVDIDYDKSIA